MKLREQQGVLKNKHENLCDGDDDDAKDDEVWAKETMTAMIKL